MSYHLQSLVRGFFYAYGLCLGCFLWLGVDHFVGAKCFLACLQFQTSIGCKRKLHKCSLKKRLMIFVAFQFQPLLKWSFAILISFVVKHEFFLLVVGDLGNGKGKSLS